MIAEADQLFDLCARCGRETAAVIVHCRPDLQARDSWPYEITGPATVTTPPLHAGADSEPMCDGCGKSLASVWGARVRSPCGHPYDLWHVHTTAVTP